MVQSPDHHAAFFAAASAAYAAAVVASIVHVASVVAATGVVVAASVGTSWVLGVVSSGGSPFEKQDVAVASAFAAVAVETSARGSRRALRHLCRGPPRPGVVVERTRARSVPAASRGARVA